MYDSLKNLLFRDDKFHVFDQFECLLNLFIFEVMNDKVKSCFKNDINQGWKILMSVFSTSKKFKIFSKQIFINEDITICYRVL